MTVVLINLPNYGHGTSAGILDYFKLYVDNLDGGATIEVDPSVYVVRPGDMIEDVAAFVSKEDAQAFADTYENCGDVERVFICDAKLAAEMTTARVQ